MVAIAEYKTFCILKLKSVVTGSFTSDFLAIAYIPQRDRIPEDRFPDRNADLRARSYLLSTTQRSP